MDRNNLLKKLPVLIIVMSCLYASSAMAGTTGIIAGTVTDIITGQALQGVKLSIDATGENTLTNESGYYVFTNVLPGEHILTAATDGYTTVKTSNISVLMDMTSTIDISMQPDIAAEENILVIEKSSEKKKDAVPSMYVIDSKQEKMTISDPNTLYQISGIVKTQPGVIVDSDGWPHIRGGRANQIGYMIDGIPVTEPVTNGFGTNSITAGLDKMEIFTGGYLPEYGNAISGIFNQVIKTGELFDGKDIQLLSGTNDYLGFYPEFGGRFNDKTTYYASGYAWQSDFDGTSFNQADSIDMVLKLNHNLSEKNKLTFLSSNGSALYRFPYEHTQTLDYSINDATVLIPTDPEKDHSHQAYNLNALTFTHSFSPTSFISVKPYVFKNKWEFDAISDFYTAMGVFVKGKSTTKGLKLDYVNQINQMNLLKAGFIGMASSNNFRSAVPEMLEYDYQANTDTKQLGIYLQDQIKLGAKWQFETGLRYDRMKYNPENMNSFSESQISPRVSITNFANNNTSIKLSYGKMIQFVQTQAIDRYYINPFWEMMYPNAERLYPERSTQFDLGIEHQINKDYSLLVTPFTRKFKNLLQTKSIDPSAPGDPPYIYENLGTGTSNGIELQIKKRPSKNWSGWISYTYLKAKASASGTGLMVENDDIYVDWDQRHTVAAVLNYMKNGWTYSLLGEYGSGLPYTISDGPTNSERVGSHFVLNANISKQIENGLLGRGTIHLGVSNIFNERSALTKDGNGDPVNKLPSRFFNLTYTKHL